MPQRLRGGLALSVSTLALLCATAALAQNAGSGFIIDVPPPSRSTGAPAANPGASAVRAPTPGVAQPLTSDGAPPWARVKTSTLPALSPIQGEGEGPDETALRYYAALNQTNRVNIEIARLKRLYPAWEPPDNLYEVSKVAGDDEQQYWDLFAADRVDELRQAIETRKREEPGWNPSPDLASKVRAKSLRMKIMDFWRRGKLTDLAKFAKSQEIGPDDADVDVMWTVAETYARTKQNADAIRIFKDILNSDKDPEERIATIQKAMSCLRMSDVEPLLAMAKTDANGGNEFAPIAVDITRARISAFLHDERPDELPVAEMKNFEGYARGARDPNEAGLVGWYYFKTKIYKSSLDWFKFALSRGGDAMIAHGLAHSLRQLGMYRETEEVAYAWREPLINNAILFIDILERDLTKQVPPYIEPERLQRYAQVTMDLASGEGAQGLGWYAYNTCQYNVAYAWFQRANAWLPKEATAYGLALASRKVGRMREFFDVINRYDGLFPKLVELVFPDNMYHPPTPCDLLSASDRDRQAMLAAANGGAPAMPQQPLRPTIATARQQPWQMTPAVSAAPGYAPLPGYGATQAYGYRQDAPPKLKPDEFPLAVNSENPLRFSPSGKLMTQPAPLGRAAPPPEAIAREPWRGAQPLVARRVPGVGPMPYERYGYTLLPSWTGATAADDAHSAESAPVGSLWATDLAEDAKATRGATDADAARLDLMTTMQTIANAPRVPAPETMQMSQPPIPFAPSPIGLTQAAALAPPTAPLADPGVTAPPPPTSIRGAYDEAARQALQFYKSGDYVSALSVLDSRAASSPEPTDLLLVRAWSLMHLNRPDEARAIFASLGKKKGLAQSRVRPTGRKP